jgi:hypothetical protein
MANRLRPAQAVFFSALPAEKSRSQIRMFCL